MMMGWKARALVLSISVALAMAKVSMGVHRAFELASTADVVVEYARPSSVHTLMTALPIHLDHQDTSSSSQLNQRDNARRTAMYQTLVAESTKARAALVAQFPSAQCTHVWIKTSAFCNGLTVDQVHGIAALSSVHKIDVPFTVRLHSTLSRDGRKAVLPVQKKAAADANISSDDPPSSSSSRVVEWGVATIGAPDVWHHTTGEGIVVGSIDTGANANHEAIKHNFRRVKGWFNPYNTTTDIGGDDLPMDSHGHGTHTIGTMVGSHGIGVAPGAQWIACLGLNGDVGSQLALVQCAQFVMCPSRQDGSHSECKLGADVVNNSWGDDGGGAYNDWFQDIVAIWQYVGITPVFSAGNSGPNCATTGNPARYDNVLAVGAVGSYANDPTQLAFFSAKGPVATGYPSSSSNAAKAGGWRGKPDVVAPGFFTVSANARDDAGYMALAGTSMASPHVAGVVALLKSKQRDLTYADIYRLITSTADRAVLQPEPAAWTFKNGSVLGPGAVNCGDVLDSAWPNNRYGYGRVNVAAMFREDGSLKCGEGNDNGDASLSPPHSLVTSVHGSPNPSLMSLSLRILSSRYGNAHDMEHRANDMLGVTQKILRHLKESSIGYDPKLAVQRFESLNQDFITHAMLHRKAALLTLLLRLSLDTDTTTLYVPPLPVTAIGHPTIKTVRTHPHPPRSPHADPSMPQQPSISTTWHDKHMQQDTYRAAVRTHDTGAAMDIPENVLLQEVLYAFQGIDSKYTFFNPSTDRFEVARHVGVSLPMRNLIRKLTEVGWLFNRVQQFVGRAMDGGVVTQSFHHALKAELSDFYRLLAVLSAQVDVDAAKFPLPDAMPELTLKRLIVWTQDPLDRLRVMAALVDR
ncbi:hypothetical protein DYB35_003511 [Aphanomyces astaci]|uniref:subtilisin n=1 Tax=Aphanomyces astaci TaxID=112090 RepID=A0A418D3Y2_APHAT|nr:hypothetical protein DYB35_003511 [Aphanomyces astaci]